MAVLVLVVTNSCDSQDDTLEAFTPDAVQHWLGGQHEDASEFDIQQPMRNVIVASGPDNSYVLVLK